MMISIGDLSALLQKATKIASGVKSAELNKVLLDIQTQSLELFEALLTEKEKNTRSTTENERLKDAFGNKDDVVRGDSCVWQKKEDEWVGPLCVSCWDANQRLIGLSRTEHRTWICGQCKTNARIMTARPPGG